MNIKRGKLYKREMFNLELFSNLKKRINFFIYKEKKKKDTEYNKQLRSKQKIKRYYCIKENNLFRYVVYSRKKNVNLLSILEYRLDNVLYRTGYFLTRKSARQYINHKHVRVNNIVVNIPSYLLSIDSVILLDKSSKFDKKITINKWIKVISNKIFIINKPDLNIVCNLFDIKNILSFYNNKI